MQNRKLITFVIKEQGSVFVQMHRECKIFDKRLKVKITKLGFSSFYRLKECLQAEKDYFELLMEGW